MGHVASNVKDNEESYYQYNKKSLVLVWISLLSQNPLTLITLILPFEFSINSIVSGWIVDMEYNKNMYIIHIYRYVLQFRASSLHHITSLELFPQLQWYNGLRISFKQRKIYSSLVFLMLLLHSNHKSRNIQFQHHKYSKVICPFYYNLFIFSKPAITTTLLTLKEPTIHLQIISEE